LCEFVNSANFTADPVQAFIDEAEKQKLTVAGYDSRLQLNDTTPHSEKAGR